MKKQITAVALGLLMAVNLMQTMTASAANEQEMELKMPEAQTKTFILPAENISTSDGIGNVEVEVTYTGWLGEIDAEANGLDGTGGANAWMGGPSCIDDATIAVLEEGSEIIFTIHADNEGAYKNSLYDSGEDDVIGMESAFGVYYIDNVPMQIFGEFSDEADKANARLAGIGTRIEDFATRLEDNKYSYKVINGLASYNFLTIDEYYVKYIFGPTLTINEEQVKELQETGTMTFLKGASASGHSVEYQHVYKGLPELLGIKVEEKPLTFIVEKDNVGQQLGDEHYYDNGASYKATVTNNTNEEVNDYYALISYSANYYGNSEVAVQIHYFDINLKPFESTDYGFSSYYLALASGEFKFLWVKFDSLQEKQKFDKTVPYGYDVNLENRALDSTKSIDWMKENFGIEIK